MRGAVPSSRSLSNARMAGSYFVAFRRALRRERTGQAYAHARSS